MMANGEVNGDLIVTIELDGLGKFNTSLSDVKKKAEDSGKAVDKGINDPIKRLPKEANTAAQGLRSLNYVFQDSAGFAYGLQTGLMGIGNNIPMLFENFQRLKAETGGTASAFKAFGATLMGPAGILTGVSLLVTAITVLPSLFRDSKKEADQFAESVKGAVNVQNDLDRVEINYDQAKKALAEQDSIVAGISKKIDRIKIDQMATSGVTLYLTDQQKEQVKTLEEQLKFGTAIQQSLKEKTDQYSVIKATNQKILQLGGETVNNTNKGVESARELAKALNDVKIEYMDIAGSPLIRRKFGEEIPKPDLKPTSPFPVEQIITDGEVVVSATEDIAFRMQNAWSESARVIGQTSGRMADAIVAPIRGAKIQLDQVFRDIAASFVANFIEAGLGWLFNLGLTALGVPAPVASVLSGGTMALSGGGNITADGGTFRKDTPMNFVIETPSADATRVYYRKVNREMLIPDTETFTYQNTAGRNPYNKKA